MNRTAKFVLLAAALEALLALMLNRFWNQPRPVHLASERKLQILHLGGGKTAEPSPLLQEHAPAPTPPEKITAPKTIPRPNAASRPATRMPERDPQNSTTSQAPAAGGTGPEVSKDNSGGTDEVQTDQEMQRYLRRVLALVARRKYYPRSSRELGEEGLVIVQVRIARSGEILRYALTRTSPHERLNEAAKKTLDGLKFPPLPVSYDGGTLNLEIPFRYRLQ